ncbi:hypothetical protein WN73_18235 [Bradyrhizobium sp. CCBAU 45394]|nr:hypothetical protein [Bradyrhizobium sp. CCBAU 45394]
MRLVCFSSASYALEIGFRLYFAHPSKPLKIGRELDSDRRDEGYERLAEGARVAERFQGKVVIVTEQIPAASLAPAELRADFPIPTGFGKNFL